MGIGAVLFFSLVFAVAFACAGICGMRLARRIQRPPLRRVLSAAAIAVAMLGSVPFAGNLWIFLWPRSSMDPREAIAQIFPTPLPPDIEPIAAMRTVSSDWYSLHVAVRLETPGVEWLQRSRNLETRSASGDKDFLPPTTQALPEFWPRQFCTDARVYSRNHAEAHRSLGLRAFDSIYVLHCPAQGIAYVWAVDVD